ncbi:hypothetical protein [Nonomuraea maritima]|uniref:hypothetical protein n=1 Tax=Nonomuraea maritima TaxID=683260 RepID=UPI003714D50B
MLDETLMYALIKVVRTSRNRPAAAMVPLGLHPGQEMLLNQLWKQDGLTQGELIARLGVEPPTNAPCSPASSGPRRFRRGRTSLAGTTATPVSCLFLGSSANHDLTGEIVRDGSNAGRSAHAQ